MIIFGLKHIIIETTSTKLFCLQSVLPANETYAKARVT